MIRISKFYLRIEIPLYLVCLTKATKKFQNKNFFFQIFQVYFKRCEIPIQWSSAQDICSSKVNSPSENKLTDFHPSAPLNVGSKRFFQFSSGNSLHNNKFISNFI